MDNKTTNNKLNNIEFTNLVPEHESESNLTLIIDGNWLLMSRLSIIAKDYYGDTETMMKKLKLLLCRSIEGMVRQFSDIDNIIFVADGGSWRDNITVPSCVSEYNIKYKGQREKTEGIDWNVVFKEYGNFVDELHSYSNITVTRHRGVEGDDWCFYWSTVLNNDGTNVIIWSADRDLTQLVKTNDTTGVFTITLYTRGKNVVLTKESNKINENTYDIGMLFGNPLKTANSSLLYKIEQKCTEIRRINPEMVVLDKIFRGDVSDNIFPCVKRVTKSGKEFRIAEKMLCEFDGDITDDEAISYFIDNIYNSKQFKNATAYSQSSAFEHALYNRQLVTLNEKYYPDEIKEIIASYSYYNKTNDISVTYQHLQAEYTDGLNVTSPTLTSRTTTDSFLETI